MFQFILQLCKNCASPITNSLPSTLNYYAGCPVTLGSLPAQHPQRPADLASILTIVVMNLKPKSEGTRRRG